MNDSRLEELQRARGQFLALTAEVRPELVRYCARMLGSQSDGEDVVQESLAHGFYALGQLRELPSLRGWLFRIAHHRVLNALAARRGRELREVAEPLPDVDASDMLLERSEAATLGLGRFLELAPAQRACVILKDVLDATLEEIATLLELTLPAVKAALHRGRTRLQALEQRPAGTLEHSPVLRRYAELFNDHDWDGLRALLSEDVKLDLVGREARRGKAAVGNYFTNYARLVDCRLELAGSGGEPFLRAVRASGDAYRIELEVEGMEVLAIRDFRYASAQLREGRGRTTT